MVTAYKNHPELSHFGFSCGLRKLLILFAALLLENGAHISHSNGCRSSPADFTRDQNLALLFQKVIFKTMTAMTARCCPHYNYAAAAVFIFIDFLAPPAQQLREQTSCSLTRCQGISVTVKPPHSPFSVCFSLHCFHLNCRCHRRGSPLTCRISSRRPRLNASPHNAAVLRCQSLPAPDKGVRTDPGLGNNSANPKPLHGAGSETSPLPWISAQRWDPKIPGSALTRALSLFGPLMPSVFSSDNICIYFW